MKKDYFPTGKKDKMNDHEKEKNSYTNQGHKATLSQICLMSISVGSMTFGGGYAMLPVLQREVIEKRKWAIESEVLDYYAMSQCLPGLLMVNTLTLIGRKVGGKKGGFVAAIGAMIPSFMVILIIAALLDGMGHYDVVESAFAGVRVAVCVLVLNSVIKLGQVSLKDFLTKAIFVTVTALSAVIKLSPFVYVMAAGALGVFYCWLKEERKEQS